MSPKFPHRFRDTVLEASTKSFLVLITGLSPCIVALSRAIHLGRRRFYVKPIHHISYIFLYRIQFALGCVQSLLLTASQLISFPAGTKTFQFPAFPILTDLIGSPIQESLVQRLHAPSQSIK